MARKRSHIGMPEQSDANTVRFWCGRSAPLGDAPIVGTTARSVPTCTDCIAAYAFASGE